MNEQELAEKNKLTGLFILVFCQSLWNPLGFFMPKNIPGTILDNQTEEIGKWKLRRKKERKLKENQQRMENKLRQENFYPNNQ